MRSNPSPPQEAEQIRKQSLTPESPKPVHYPSPSNIPILEKQMDPMFQHDASLSIGTPASFQSYPPSAQSTTPFLEQQNTAMSQNAALQNSVASAPSEYYQSTGYSGVLGGQAQDISSIQTLPPSNQAPTAQYREATSTPAQDSRPAYPISYDPNAYAAQTNQAQSSQGSQYQPNTGGNVNYQMLLDSLSPAASNGASDRHATPSVPAQASLPQGQTPISSIPVAANLPPRPPAQEKPTTHPNYSPGDDIRSYHPHSQKTSNTQSHGPGQLQNINTRGGPSNPDIHSARSNQSPSTPGYRNRQSVDMGSPPLDDEDERWPPQVNKLYEDFLEEERKFVTDGQWDQFPAGSRLFIGNLPTEKVTKRDIFHRFYRHGALAQISIKQAYGFVQFLDSESCYKALQAEQGRPVRGRKMHLEISKPQRNTKKSEAHTSDRNSARRRSRSPDYTRGGGGGQPRNVDRYVGGQNAMSPRDRDNRRFRDDYRSMRSPSPRGARGGRGRDRSRDRYDGWRRSRSRSPRRYRSPSPRQVSVDDDLPLPRRAAHQVPDVQVLVINEGLPRDFIRWVEDTFRQLGLRIDVLILSPRLSEIAVIRRQIVEGVLAIVKLTTASVAKSKVDLQLFDRRGGADNIQFNEYADLEPSIAAALVSQAKQTQAQPVQSVPSNPYAQGYGAPPLAASSYTPVSAAYAAPATNNNSQASNMLSSLDSNSLSQLLGAMSGGSAAQPMHASPANTASDLARLLGAISAPAGAQSYPAAAPTLAPNYQNPGSHAAIAAFLGNQVQGQVLNAPPPVQTPTQASPVGQPDMNEIMAQLAKYQR